MALKHNAKGKASTLRIVGRVANPLSVPIETLRPITYCNCTILRVNNCHFGGMTNSKKGRCPHIPLDVNGFFKTILDNKKPAILEELRVYICSRISPDLEMVAMQGLEPRTPRI